MTWQAVVLSAIGMIQVVALAWIAARQQQVKRDLREYNGTVARQVEAVPAVIQADLQEHTEQIAEKVEAVPDAVLEAAIRRGVEIEIARAQEQK